MIRITGAFNTDVATCRVLDELIFLLVTEGIDSPLAEKLKDCLQEFAKREGLDWDIHCFARLPVSRKGSKNED